MWQPATSATDRVRAINLMTLHSFRSLDRQLMVAGRLVYCRPAAKDWDVSPVFAVCQRLARAAKQALS